MTYSKKLNLVIVNVCSCENKWFELLQDILSVPSELLEGFSASGARLAALFPTCKVQRRTKRTRDNVFGEG